MYFLFFSSHPPAQLQQLERPKRKSKNEDSEDNSEEDADPHKGVPWTAEQLRKVYAGQSHQV